MFLLNIFPFSIGVFAPPLHFAFVLHRTVCVVTILLVNYDMWLLFRLVSCIAQSFISSSLGVSDLHGQSP